MRKLLSALRVDICSTSGTLLLEKTSKEVNFTVIGERAHTITSKYIRHGRLR